MSTPTVYFQRFLTGEARLPTKSYPGDAGWDLFISRECEILPGDVANLHTDLAVAIPQGWYGHILPRSSSLKRYGLEIVPAVIDAGFRGELFVQARSVRVSLVTHLLAGTRVAQMLILPVPAVEWVEVEALPKNFRGTNGFGSSGT